MTCLNGMFVHIKLQKKVMSNSDEEDEKLATFLESEVLSESSDRDTCSELGVSEPQNSIKLRRTGECDHASLASTSTSNNTIISKPLDSRNFSKIPHELFHQILKYLSSEDLVACALVCRFLNQAASDELLWHRLYCMRWGLLPHAKGIREVAWKKLYIERDEEDMVEFVRNCPCEFKQYYIQMQAAKRSQAPLPSQVKDDNVILEKTVSEYITMWKSSRGLSDKVAIDHVCSGYTCSYHQIGDVFVCEKTGHVHVCDDTCREVVLDPVNGLLVCTISGHCLDRLLEPEWQEQQQQGGVMDEAEPFMGSGRFARAYSLGYNCADEKELEYALRFC